MTEAVLAGPGPARRVNVVKLAALALLAIVLQVVWLTRSPGRVEAGRIRPLRPERRGAV